MDRAGKSAPGVTQARANSTAATHHAKSLGARWEVRVLLQGRYLGGQRQPSGESDISCLSSRYPPRSQRRREVRRIASPAGIIVCSSYRQGASKLEFIILNPPSLNRSKPRDPIKVVFPQEESSISATQQGRFQPSRAYARSCSYRQEPSACKHLLSPPKIVFGQAIFIHWRKSICWTGISDRCNVILLVNGVEAFQN